MIEPPELAIGMISGTSADGIDAVVAEIVRRSPGSVPALRVSIVDRERLEYTADLRERALAAIDPATGDVELLCQLHFEVGRAFGEVAARLVERNPGVTLVGCHGQTVYHVPDVAPQRGWRTRSTLQLGAPAAIALACRRPVYTDFRTADMLLGGQGAPLVPYADWAAYADRERTRALHNLGGISNTTVLPRGGLASAVLGFDTGPANALLDEAAQRRLGAPRDENGLTAARGRPDQALLSALLQHEYLSRPAPKSTGRETFTWRLIENQGGDSVDTPDLLATLTEYTAVTVADAYRRHVPVPVDEIFFAGGGTRNGFLMDRLRFHLGEERVRTTADIGLEPMDREAQAFAVLAFEARAGRPNILPSVTGASAGASAGSLTRPPVP